MPLSDPVTNCTNRDSPSWFASTWNPLCGCHPDLFAAPGQLIDAAGCRGLLVGDAQVSELHCNFLINLGDATATDIETLGETVRRRVKDTSGVDLEWEIKRIGSAA